MSRDVSKLRVFQTADDLLMKVYQATSTFPADERFGIQSQLRRGCGLGSSQHRGGILRAGTLREYVNFLNVATASSAEVAYLLSVAGRLGLLESYEGKQA
jgi:four helix bundle protein